MFEIIVTGCFLDSSMEVQEDGADPVKVSYVSTQIHRFEFDTFSDMQNAISSLATAHGCVHAEMLQGQEVD